MAYLQLCVKPYLYRRFPACRLLHPFGGMGNNDCSIMKGCARIKNWLQQADKCHTLSLQRIIFRLDSLMPFRPIPTYGARYFLKLRAVSQLAPGGRGFLARVLSGTVRMLTLENHGMAWRVRT